MIFSLTDETYSILCALEQKDTRENDRLFLAVSILNHCYWIVGSVLGSLIGDLITFDTTGIDFAMTALFVVIFIEQWLDSKSHIPAITGGICGVLSLIIFGADKFILPSLIATVFLLTVFKNKLIERGLGK